MNTFNPATFLDVTNMSDRAVQRMGHADEADSRGRSPAVARQVQDLEQAAARFALRRDNFAVGKSATCLDLAAKLERFGSFVSEKQADFARKLVEWSLPRGQQAAQTAPGAAQAAPVAPTPAPVPAVRLERLHAVMQGMAKLRFRKITLARKNGDQLVWVKVTGHDGVVGRIDGGVLTIFTSRLNVSVHGVTPAEIETMLKVIDLDPKAAAAAHGIESGNCSVCGRDLTDPKSIALGIGPVCLGNF